VPANVVLQQGLSVEDLAAVLTLEALVELRVVHLDVTLQPFVVHEFLTTEITQHTLTHMVLQMFGKASGVAEHNTALWALERVLDTFVTVNV
jgi:hypothetical protein